MRRFGSTVVIGLTIFALVDGFLIGLVASIFAQTAMAASPPVMDTNEYVWLVSVDYDAGRDLPMAARRLSALPNGSVTLPGLVRRVARQAESRHEAMRATSLTRLAVALSGDVAVAIDDPTVVATEMPTVVVTAKWLVPTVGNAAIQAPVAAVGRSASAGSTEAATAIEQPGPPPTASGPTPTPSRPRPTPSHPAPTLAHVKPTVAAVQGRIAPQNPPSRASTASPAVSSSIDFKVELVRQLTACENGGNHHLHIMVLDQQGNGIPNLPVEIVWPSGSHVDTTGKKVEFIQSLGIDSSTTPGYLNFPMYHGQYKIRVLAGISEQTDWLTVDIPHGELCARTDNPVANSLFHYSYLVLFRKAR